MAMRQTIPSGRRRSRSPNEADYNGPGLPSSPKISVSPVPDEHLGGLHIGSSRGNPPLDKVVEVKGVGSGGQYYDPGGGRKLPSTPMPGSSGIGNGGRLRERRSLPSSGGSMSSMSSGETGGNGGRRPPTSLSVLSANSLAEVQRNILQRHSSLDGGLTPPPRVISIENQNGFKVMTELVDHSLENGDKNVEQDNPVPDHDVPTKNKNLSSKYQPLKPISKRK